MKSKKLVMACAFVFGVAFAVQVYAACNGTKAGICNANYSKCVSRTGGDPTGECEVAYNQCLVAAGCDIP